MRKLALLIFLLVLSLQVLAQEKPQPILVGEYVDKKNSPALTSKIEEFLSTLSKEPNTTKGVVISYRGFPIYQDCDGNPNVPNSDVEDRTKQYLVSQSRSLADRTTFILGTDRLRSTLEFWLVPENATPPKPTYVDSDPGWCCREFSVIGPTTNRRKSTAKFMVKLEGNESAKGIHFRWTLSEGRIIRGQGTSEIIVDLSKTKGPAITAMAAFGLDPAASCPEASFTTKIP